MVPHADTLEDQYSLPRQSNSVRAPRKERLPRILSVEWQDDLLIRRALFLQPIGCIVRSAGPPEVSDLVRATFYRVVVFGHTVSDADAAELAVRTKVSSPGTRLVLVTGSQPRPRIVESLFDAIVPEAGGPAALAISVRQLLTGHTPEAVLSAGGYDSPLRHGLL